MPYALHCPLTWSKAWFGIVDTSRPAPFPLGMRLAIDLGTDRHIVPGALLALPHAVARAAPISHPVALRVRDALQHYGAYLVDSSSGYANKVSISVSQGVNDELVRLFNVSLAGPRGITPDSPGHSAWLYRDLLTLLRSLHAVTNNWPTSVGGGGTPLVPRAPPICG